MFIALGLEACASDVGPAGDGGVADHAVPQVWDGPICPREDYESWRTTEVYHLADGVDEVNAAFKADGVVRWHAWGCDYAGGQEARWLATSSTTIRIEPPPGETTFFWPGGVFRWVEYERDVVLGTLRPVGGNPFPQEELWMRGWVCKLCVRGGPSPVVLCAGDVPASHIACP